MKQPREWLNEVGETVATSMFAGKQPPGVEVEELIARIQADARSFPPLPQIHDGPITRADVITSLIELRDMGYAYERSKDSAFRRCPDLEKVLEYIAIHGLAPRSDNTDLCHGSEPLAPRNG